MKGSQVIGPSPEETYRKSNSEAQVKIGKKGVCNITNEKDAVIELVNKNSEIFLLLDPDYNICSGDLFIKSDSAGDKKVNVVPKTMSECKDLSFSNDKENCIKLTVKSVSDCNIFSFAPDKSMCIKQVAIKKKDSSICSLLSGSNIYDTFQSECYGEIAALKNDYGICSIDMFDKLKTDPKVSNDMSVECIKKYCSIRGVDGWWGCGN